MAQMTVDDTGILRLTVSTPPAGPMTTAARAALSEALERAFGDAEVRAILLEGAGRAFSIGVPAAELSLGAAREMAALCRRIEAADKPVIALLGAPAVDGGAELALAAHWRLAHRDALIGFGGVQLGLPPMAGASQRLARLLGAAAAIELLEVGQPVTAAEAARLGLVDRVVEDDLAAAGAAFAAELLAAGTPPRRAGEATQGLADAAAFQRDVAAARARAAGAPLAVQARLVDCVEAAQLLPFAAGLTFEETAFEESLAGDEAAALIHVHLAERRAERPPELAGQRARRVATLAVAGAAAPGWTVAALDAGLAVTTLSGHAPGDLAERVAAHYQGEVAAGRIADAEGLARLDRLDAAGATPDFAIIDRPEAAEALPAETIVALLARPGGPALTAPLPTPDRALGLLPAPQGRFVELLAGEATSPAALASALRLMRRLGRVAAISPAAEGGMLPMVWGAAQYAARMLAGTGVSAAGIDGATAAWGLARPLLSGSEGAAGEGRAMDADEIVQRVLDAMANAGALLLEAGIARRAGDVDLALIHGTGMARRRGGPLFQADRGGLAGLRKRLVRRAEAEGDFWAPVALIDTLILEGRHFADLDGG